MTYVVLARKWRPRTFEDLTGQQHVAQTLQNAIGSGRIPHAVLFTGARGVGKTSTARIFSMALNCESGPTPNPCGTCRACQEAQGGRSVDILEIDGASNRGINEIRELRDSVQYTPSRDRYKIYIIDEVHMLTTEAFNALLKTLEEPPAHVVFIFATTEPQKIPVTILSRCQRFDFKQIGLRDLVGRLTHIASAEGLKIEDEALQLIARQANGGMRDALSLLDQVISFAGEEVSARQCAEILGATDRRVLFDISDAIINNDAGRALASLRDVLSFGADMRWFAGELAGHFRDLTVISVAPDAISTLELSDAEAALAREQVARSSTALLEACLEIMVEAAEEIARSSFAVLRMELALIRMAELKARRSLEDVIALLEGRARDPRPLPKPRQPAPDANAPTPARTPEAASTPGHSRETASSPARREQKGEESEDEPAPGSTPERNISSVSAPEVSAPEVSGFTGSGTSRGEQDVRAAAVPGSTADRSGPAPTAAPTDRHVVADANVETTTDLPPKRIPTETDARGDAAPRIADSEPLTEPETSGATPASTASAHSDAEPQAELSSAQWRELIERVSTELNETQARALATSYARPAGGAIIELACEPALLPLLPPSFCDAFSAVAADELGVRWDLRPVSLSDWSAEEIAQAWHIAGIERDEESARRASELKRVQGHEVTKLLKQTWPEAQFDIEYRPDIPHNEGNPE